MNLRCRWTGSQRTCRTRNYAHHHPLTQIAAAAFLACLFNLGRAQPVSPSSLPAVLPNQLPTGGSVVRGMAIITSDTPNSSLSVQQSSARAVIDWQTFNIGHQASVRFVQPDTQAITLNRVLDANPSQIQGRLSANGQVFISNPQGIYFSSTSQADVGGLVASTHSLSLDDFMAGRTQWQRQGASGAVSNEGTLRARMGGYIALLAPEVRNQGVVIAQAGTVALASGEAITLQFDGPRLSGLTTSAQTIAALVDNQQAILAEGGQIILSANALSQLQGGVVRNSGQLNATSLSDRGGLVLLEGGDILLSRTSQIQANGPQGGGTVLVGGDWQGQGLMRQATTVVMASGASIDASATQQGSGGQIVLFSALDNPQGFTSAQGSLRADGGPSGGDGGRIETSGHRLAIGDMQVSTHATQGVNGQWLLDPYNITISDGVATNMDGSNNATGTGAIVNNTTLSSALGSGNVTVTTGSAGGESGNITVANDINWSSANALTLTAAGSIAINAAISNTSTGDMTFNAAGTGGITGNTSGNIQVGPTTGTPSTDPGGRLTFNVTHASGNGIYAGTISGNGQLIKTGAGTVQLDGANTFKGGTSVQSGGITIVGTSTGVETSNSVSALGSSGSAVEVQANGTVSLTNVVSNWTGPSWKLTGSGRINLISSGASNYSYLSATETTAGGPASSFSGTISVSGNGYNHLGNSNFSNAAVNVTTSGFGLFLSTGRSLMLGELSGNGMIRSSLSAGGTDTLIVGGKNTNSTFTGLLSNYSTPVSTQRLAFKKVGTGTLTLSSLSTYTGSTTVSAGTLLFDRPASLYGGTPSNWTASNIIVASGATLAVKAGGAPFPFTSSHIDTLAALGSGFGGFLSGSFLGISTSAGDFTYNSVLRNPNGGANTLGLVKLGNNTLTLSNTNSYSGGTRVSGGTLRINDGGSLGAGDVVLSNNATLSYQRSTDTILANAITGNGNVLANVSSNGSLTVNGAITLSTGAIALTTANADLTVNQPLSTGSTTGTVLTLSAGQSNLAGTSTGGDIALQGSSSLSVGAGAQGLLYTGSLSGSLGLASLIGSGSGRFRYNSNANTSNFATPLSGLGLFAIYREAPSLTVTLNHGLVGYNGLNYSGGEGYTLSGLHNGDTQAQSVSGAMVYGGTAQGARNVNASPYTLTGSGLSSELGYQLSYTSANLTIQPSPASVTATPMVVTYDGNTQTQTATTSGFLLGDDIAVAGLASGRNVGTYTSNLSVGGTDASNYAISLTNNDLSINQATPTQSTTRLTLTLLNRAGSNTSEPPANSDSEDAISLPEFSAPTTHYLLQNLSDLKPPPLTLGNAQPQHIRVLINPLSSSVEIPLLEILQPINISPSTRVALEPVQGEPLPQWLDIHPTQQILRLHNTGPQEIAINALLSVGAQEVLLELRRQ